jgi:hypothetical protein
MTTSEGDSMKVKTRTVINIHTHEIAYTSKSAGHAFRKCMELGANPAGWIVVSGGPADAKAAAAIYAEKVETP